MDGNKKIKSLLVFAAFILIYSCQVKRPVAVQFFEPTSVTDNITDTVLNDEYHKAKLNQTDLIVYNKNSRESAISTHPSTDTVAIKPILDSVSNNFINRKTVIEQDKRIIDTVFNTHYIIDSSVFINYSRSEPETRSFTNQENIDSVLYLNILNSLDSIQNLLNLIASKKSMPDVKKNALLVSKTNIPKNTTELTDDSEFESLLKIKSDSINYLQQKIQLYENIDDTSKINFLLPNFRSLQDSMYRNLLTQKSDSILVLNNKINQDLMFSNYDSQKLYLKKDSLSYSNKQHISINRGDSIQKRTLKTISDSTNVLPTQFAYYQTITHRSDSSQNNQIIKQSNLAKDSAAYNDIPIVKLKYDTIYKYINKYDSLSFVGYYKPNKLSPANIIEIKEQISNIDSSLVTSILIAAYTDISGSASINYELSNKRILEFENILLNDFDFDKRIIYKQTFGSIYSTYPQNEKERKIVIKFILLDKIE
ncbi:MAG: hypothetical protein PHP52_04200 [Bacteroidales bacterium]|nr:hypothetical protein [Bacteroidales bacterium]